MIPLSSTEGTKKFPTLVLVWIIFLIGLYLLTIFLPGSRTQTLGLFSLTTHWTLRGIFLSPFVFPHLFSLLTALIYSWTFLPKLFEKTPPLFAFSFAFLGTQISAIIFFKIHSQFQGPLITSDAFLGVLLGMTMRYDLWASIYTLVLGPFGLRVLEVPSYVLLFFWLFYLFLGSLALPSPFAEAPMIYLLALVGFLWGFIVESLRLKIIESWYRFKKKVA